MTSATDIANLALSALGEARIADLADNSRGARAMNARYAHVRDMELSSHPWRFAVRRVTLPALAGAPAWGFPYRYARPADDLRPLMAGDHPVLPAWGAAQSHTIVGQELHTIFSAPLEYEYVSGLVTEDEFPALFVEVVSLRLALAACDELTQSDARAQRLAQMLADADRRARNSNALWSAPRGRAGPGSWLGSRM